MNKNKQAFTLVELIVVITIIAILGTIAFISLQGYSASSRDSVRISDVSNMKTSLELFHLNAGKYPLPDDYETISYNSLDLWYQGTFGSIVVSQLSRNISEIPTDPLTDKGYVFSTANNKNEFQILSLLESDIALNTITQTNAATLYVTPRIDGNYNGVFLKTATDIVPTPSIVTSENIGVGVGLILDTTNIKSQVITGGKNIPNIGNVNSATGQLIGLELSAYNGTINKNSTNTQKAAAIEAIKAAYVNESSLNNEGTYKYILSISGESDLASLFNTLVLGDSTITNLGESSACPVPSETRVAAIVKDIIPGTGSGNPSQMTPFGCNVLFTANDGIHGFELWISDGTEVGTKMVKDVRVGIGSSSITGLVVVNGIALYNANLSGVNNFMRSDGTEEGTYILTNAVSFRGNNTNYTAVIGGEMYFMGYNAATSIELWKTDGTEEGTVIVKDINPGNSNSMTNSSGFMFSILGNKLLFNATNTTSGNYELWITDGTEVGTKMVKDINISGSGLASSFIRYVVGNKVYFPANDGINGNELWVSDGTEAGTKMVKDINIGSGSSNPMQNVTWVSNLNGNLIFSANDGINGLEPWVTDGTEAGTKLLMDLYTGVGGSDPISFIVIGNKAYFRAYTTSGWKIFSTDGTTIGTVVEDSNTNLFVLGKVGLNTYYILDSKMYRTDSITGRVDKSQELIFNSYPAYFMNVGEVIFVSNYDASYGQELWKY